MKFKINKKAAVLAAVNILSMAGFLTFSLIGSSAAKSQGYNYAAERWQNDDSDMDYAQMSCFMAESAGFTTESLGQIRSGVLESLKAVSIAPEDGQKLCPDAYSAGLGSASLKGNILGKSEAELTATGGDFFLIHNFKLIDGSFFTDYDIMQDGVVIDRNLAWALFGSSEVTGMNLTINGTQFYVSGVIENPETKEEEKCSGELPRAYISYDGASNLGFSGGDSGFSDGSTVNTAFKKITCYEIIMPDPVENYAYNSVKSLIEGYGRNVSVIQNDGRFNALKRLGKLKNISSTAVRDNEIAYPYWENASRIVQFRLSYVYLCAVFCLVIPAVTAGWFLVKAIAALRRNKKRISRAVLSLFRTIRGKRRRSNNEGQEI